MTSRRNESKKASTSSATGSLLIARFRHRLSVASDHASSRSIQRFEDLIRRCPFEPVHAYRASAPHAP